MPLRESRQTRGRVEEAEESMQIRALFLATLLATLAPAAGVRAAEAEAAADVRQASLFPRPADLEPQIRFWRAVFTQYSAHQVVLHDAVHLDKVYKVLDFRSRLDDGFSDGELAGLERIETDVELDRLRATLLRLHALGPHPESLTAEERAVYDLWADDPAPDRFLAAADDKRLHGQRGLRERFAGGIRASRPYFPEMERIFREEDLPVELVRLPLIESCFDLRAYSTCSTPGRSRSPRTTTAPRAWRAPSPRSARPTSLPSCATTTARPSASRPGTSTSSSWPRSRWSATSRRTSATCPMSRRSACASGASSARSASRQRPGSRAPVAASWRA